MGRTSTTRFLMILTTATTTTPSPLLHLRCPSFLRLSLRTIPGPLSSYLPRRRLLSSPSRLGLTSSLHFHSQAAPINSSFISSPFERHPWPEWPNLVQCLSSAGYFNCEGFDAPAAVPGLPADFVRAASACFAFARDRVDILGMLPRTDIEVVVENGAPFLFENTDESVRRMRLFLTGNVLPSDRAEVAVDLMKYLLSYLSNVVSSERNNLHNADLVEPSVRNLLLMMYQLSYNNNTAQTDYRNNSNAQESYQSGLVENQVPYGYQPTARPLRQSIEMKRGDWICPRCSFMNFARNVKCLDCEEARPKKQLTGSEWECPQCEFFNYGRNTACLRCDCKRPGDVSIGTTNFGSGLEYGNGNSAFEADVGRRLAANEENSQRWLSKVSQLDSSPDTSGAIADEDFPEIMPLRKGVNRFVVSTRKTPLERRLSNAQYQRNWDNCGNLESNGGTRGSSSNYVPLPPDMFAKKPEKSGVDEREVEVNEKKPLAPGAGWQTGGRLEESLQANEKSMGHIESNDIEKERVEKSDRWFKRVTELPDVTDTSSAISDGDFPDIMPMRKGENRFVVSKKKDRSLTSPTYKRNLAMEQANTTNYVPFVPFPPNYFARKNDQQLDDKAKSLNVPEKFDETGPSISHAANVPGLENQQSGTGNLGPHGQNSGGTMTNSSYEAPTSGSSAQNAVDSPPGGSESWSNQCSTYNNTSGTQNLMMEPLQNFSSPQKSSTGTGSSGYSTSENSSNTTDFKGTSQPSEDENIGSSWRRKSLEGSQVKETDPLDMSEEAKAERWFRRVAQIKDISELSQIPDEDFPSIMPMRKGVNRFVVSKRKTPLERRLTSSKYRRNLPIVSSDPAKENDTN